MPAFLKLHPSDFVRYLRSVHTTASEYVRCFQDRAHILPLQGSDVSLLDTPSDFHDALLDGIRNAKADITLASLYIGTEGKADTAIVGALACAATKDKAERPQITVLLDALRSTRPSKDPSGQLTSTALMLGKVLLPDSASGESSRVCLFHTPALRGMLKRLLPARVSEVIGVSHLKAYVFDDDVLISGANLSTTYFTKRQDRYYLFRNAARLAAFVRSLVKVVGRFSYRLRSGGQLLPNHADIDPLTAASAFNAALKNDLETLFLPQGQRDENSSLPAGETPDTEASSNRTPGMGEEQLTAADLSERVDQIVNPDHLFSAGQAVPNLRSLHRQLPSSGRALRASNAQAEGNNDNDTFIIPMAQLGSAGVRQDEALTVEMLRLAEPGGCLTMSTAYLNLARPFERALASATRVNIELITASPAANGFFNAKGVSGFIPNAYSLLEQHTWQRLNRAWGRDGSSTASRSLREYDRPGWEFHCKGIWYTPPGEELPMAATIGSPNYGYRSVIRDLEAHFLVVTTNPSLRKAMARELHALRMHSKSVEPSHFWLPGRRATTAVTVAAHLLRDFL